MGRNKSKRKRTEAQVSSPQPTRQSQIAATLPLLQNLNLPTFNLTSSKSQGVAQPNNESGEVGNSDMPSDSGEWQTVPSKRPPKKQKLSSKESKNYPHIGPATQLKLQSRIKISDLQALVLYLAADGTAPQWVAVRHYNQVRKVVVVMVPGLERGMFDGDIALSGDLPTKNPSVKADGIARECMAVEAERLTTDKDCDKTEGREGLGLVEHGKLGMKSHLTVDVNDNKEKLYSSPDSYYPVALSENILPKPLKPLAGIFPHLWPVLTPGDDKYSRISSPIYSMLTSPVSKTKEEKKAKGSMHHPIGARDWVNKRTPITEFIASLEELRENEYVLHPVVLVSAEEKIAEENRRRLAKESINYGWVDSRIEKLEDGEPDLETIEDGSITCGRDVLAMDCEMCQTEGGDLDLTRISIVRWDGEIVLDELVKPEKAVTDYLTPYSGISKDMLDPITTTLSDIQSRLLEILHPKSILIGHSLNSDLGALKMTHPFIIDTSILYQHPRGPPLKSSLKFLAQKYLGREIQKGHGSGGHDSIEDARACLDLVKQKCERGPKWGTSEALGESIFRRLGRSHRPAKHGTYTGSSTERLGGVVDWGQPERAFGAFARVCIGCKSDEEVVEGVGTAVNGDTNGELVPGGGLDFVWARLRELEALRGWWNDSRNSADAELIARAAATAVHDGAGPVSTLDGTTAISPEVLAVAVTKTVNHIAAIYESLPPCTAMIVYSGTGDPREMSRLQALQQQFRKEYRVKNWDELSVKWTDVEEQALKRAVQTARDGLGFVVVKSILHRTAVQVLSKPSLSGPRSLTSIISSSILRSTRITKPLSLQRRLYSNEAEQGERRVEENNDQSAVSSSITGPGNEGGLARAFRSHRNPDGSELTPTTQLFVGNMLYDVTAEDLKLEMEKFGEVLHSKITMRDGRSRGFGYVEFSRLEDATRAREELNGQVFGGRVLVVNYVLRVQKALNQASTNQPSNTIFIGNIPYEMTDDDLNKLFGQFENVHEVRMAVDRKTGISRGFAHAEFLDLNSAQRAHDALKDKEILGRTLRVDYTNRVERQDAFGRRQRMRHIEPEETNEDKS